MNKCVICNKEIKNDSQFVKEKWYHNNCIENQTRKIEKLKNGIYKILKLNEYMIHCESKEVIYKFLMKQWRTIYETLEIPEPGLARCSKNDLESKGE